MTGKTLTSVKRVLLIFIAGLSVFPAFQKAFRPVWSKSLDGYSEPNPYPKFSFPALFSGTYLPLLSKHYNGSIGFHNELVRLHNQVDFTLFRIPNARRVVIGKDDYLFEEQYIKAWSGGDFIGVKNIDARAKQFREAQDWLWKEKGVLFLVLLLPDKGTFYPGYIPSRFRKATGGNTNYSWYRRKLEEQKVNCIDFNAWFLEMKDTARYSLYPKTGIHWSRYGSFLAMDSLVKYLEIKTGTELPHPESVQNRVSKTPMGRDDDVGRALNLICNITAPPLAYPVVTYSKPANRRPFSALFIGDSFYFAWAETGYIGQVFSNRDFWYYDHEVYYGTYPTGKLSAGQDLNQALLRQDAIIILQTNAGYGELGYYFVDRLFEKARK
ncbi:MAG: hypothetical protein NTW16_16475 [Bacteroidetes bacterium]|nr:hypothetical protein [Bacteroidota bacterium]